MGEIALENIRPGCEVFVNEVDFRQSLRLLGVSSSDDWVRWCSQNRNRRVSLKLPLNPVEAYGNPRFWKENEAGNPKKWKRYQQLCKQKARDSCTANLPGRFAVHYRIASGYRGLRLSNGINQSASRGYSAALGVFLAYSALETCCEVVGSPITGRGIVDCSLARNLRNKLPKPLSRIREGITSKKLLSKFNKFITKDTDDVLCFAEVLRHLVAKGDLTFLGISGVSMSFHATLDKLTQVLLHESDRLFANYCLSIERGEILKR